MSNVQSDRHYGPYRCTSRGGVFVFCMHVVYDGLIWTACLSVGVLWHLKHIRTVAIGINNWAPEMSVNLCVSVRDLNRFVQLRKTLDFSCHLFWELVKVYVFKKAPVMWGRLTACVTLWHLNVSQNQSFVEHVENICILSTKSASRYELESIRL